MSPVCPRCDGKGKIELNEKCPECSGGIIRCIACEGYGRITCVVCGGKGGIDECDNCNGRGEVTIFEPTLTGWIGHDKWIKCDKCMGLGYYPPCVKCEGSKQIDCPTCKGSGSTGCAICGGSGRKTVSCPICEGY